MTTDSTVLACQHPEEVDDPLTLILRDGARRLLAQAVEAEAFLALMKDERLADGRARIVRHGHGPEREIQTGNGPVPVKRAKLRDRGAGDGVGERIAFTSALLPKWALRTRSLDTLLPVLCLRGVSTGDFQEALAALLGKDAANLSPSVIGQLKQEWAGDWQQRDLSSRRYVYIWADGVYLQARMEDTAGCKPEEAHEGQSVLDLELSRAIRQAIERLQDHDPEHHHRIERRPAALRAV